ncbi:MAG: sensor histidine kinase [Bdellovibrionota bacterium]
MVSAKAPLSQDRLLRILQILALVISSAVVVLFLRFSLESSARSFREDFERQSFIELSRGETFLLARKLAALDKSDQISCVRATKAGLIFFEDKNGSCESGLFSVREVVKETNNEIEIQFVLKLGAALLNGLVLFLLIQFLLGVLIFLSQRRLLHLEHEHEFELAALAQQVAHDLKSPLAILRTLISGPGLPKRALERLESLVSHLQGGASSVEEPVLLAPFIEAVVEEKRAEFQGENVPELSIHWKSPVGDRRLRGNAFEWKRVFSNVLNNAIEASQTRPQISIEIDEVSADRIAIAFQDHGKGMPEKVLERLGRAGFSWEKPKGKGLGFYLAKKFAEEVGAKISVTSTVGKGTRVQFEIPTEGAKIAVLVDDDSDLALAWTAAAKRKGTSVLHYGSPAEFARAFEGLSKSAAIYIDLEFPGNEMSADQLGAFLKEKGFRTLFLCTGRARHTIAKPDWALEIVGKTPPWI